MGLTAGSKYEKRTTCSEGSAVEESEFTERGCRFQDLGLSRVLRPETPWIQLKGRGFEARNALDLGIHEIQDVDFEARNPQPFLDQVKRMGFEDRNTLV